jgi:hypothetical protein
MLTHLQINRTLYFSTCKKVFNMLTFVKWIMVGHILFYMLVLCNTKLKTSNF